MPSYYINVEHYLTPLHYIRVEHYLMPPHYQKHIIMNNVGTRRVNCRIDLHTHFKYMKIESKNIFSYAPLEKTISENEVKNLEEILFGCAVCVNGPIVS